MMHPKASSEAEILKQFTEEGLSAERWSNEPHAVYAPHHHPYGKILWVASGSIVFTLEDEKREVSMKSGDRLELPPGTVHSAVVGPQGVVCLEAHVSAGGWNA